MVVRSRKQGRAHHLAKPRQGPAMRTGISCTWLHPATACAAFIKENRMKFANATKPHRKSGDRPVPRLWSPLPLFLACRMGCIRIIGSDSTSTSKAPFRIMRPFARHAFRAKTALDKAQHPNSMLLEARGHDWSVQGIFRSRDYLFSCNDHVKLLLVLHNHEHPFTPRS
jgi:hypothetical protein